MTGILSTRALYYSSSRYIQEDQTPVRELCMNDLLQRLQYGIEWIDNRFMDSNVYQMIMFC